MDSISLHALMRLFPLFCISMQAASPACTELETVMLDWLGKMVNLPEEFLAGKDGQGGGVIQVRADMKKERHVCGPYNFVKPSYQNTNKLKIIFFCHLASFQVF